jgi:hypothetical protein
MQVARLVADLEPRHSELADFMFISRFDCTQDPSTMEYVSRKFDVHHYVNKDRRGEGWPFGCNELWFGTVDRVYTLAQAKLMPTYKAVLTFEADAYPLSPGWIGRLSMEWDRLHAKGANMIGALIDPGPHINGNCLVSGEAEYLHWLARKLGGCSPQGGWDYLLRDKFKQHGWAGSKLFRSHWRAPTMSEGFFENLLKEKVCLCHGVKDDSVDRMVRRRYLTPAT